MSARNLLISALQAIVGAPHVLLAADDQAPYCQDWRGRYQGQALCVVRPADTAQVAAVVAACAKAGVAIVPQGGNTGLCGGATPLGGEVLISLRRLNGLRAVDPDNNTITVEAGMTLLEVQAAAAAAGRFFPLSLASEGSATIGGNLSTNAGGVQVLRYGNTRDLVLGLEVVLPDGQIWNGLRALRKDNTGYDLKHLFIGAEGTLGLITAAVLKLFPPLQQQLTAWVEVPSPQSAVALLNLLRNRLGDRIVAFELIGQSALELVLRHIPDTRAPFAAQSGWQVLIELGDPASTSLEPDFLAALEEAQAQGHCLEVAMARHQQQAKALWRLRETISDAQRFEGFSVKHDIALPISRIGAFLEAADAALKAAYPGVRIVCFGHLGDGNLHYNPSMPDGLENAALIQATPAVNRIVHDLVAAHGGSISAEHGLGQLKREEVRRYKSPLEIKLMAQIKEALDPQSLMNPGKIF